jgi:hypothetical protein
MLQIRPEQLVAFEGAEIQKFEDWVFTHLQRFFPGKCAAAGETAMRAMIHEGMQRGSSYGISAKRDLCKYIDLMVVLGRHFDEKAWAREILAKRLSPASRIQRLQQAAGALLRRS